MSERHSGNLSGVDRDGDGFVGGYDEFGTWVSENDPLAVYNADGRIEYDNKGYFDDPWYLAIGTAWLDDWFFGGDIDHDGDRVIGGWSWDAANDADGDGVPDVDELVEDFNLFDENRKSVLNLISVDEFFNTWAVKE